MRAHLVVRSANKKTGPIPVSVTEEASCPPSCKLRGSGCYAHWGYSYYAWRPVNEGLRGVSWDEFCDQIASLPDNQLWRHNEAGDLPGYGEVIDEAALRRLVDANRGRRGHTFTHKYTLPENRALIRWSNQHGFTVNLSAEGLEQADALSDFGVGPVTTVAPADVPRWVRTPGGRLAIVCPAMRVAGVQCSSCGLCAVATRKAIVMFPAHGNQRKAVDQFMRSSWRPALTADDRPVARA